ncbi:helix-turn-helix transcriptional regulator [Brachybacterium alimentarium]|uniref:helix-turn-helix transcriptional regulator n=1 Tax=Brachybacterium alimentarium TaxID=47845 RepID=UPI003FD087E4
MTQPSPSPDADLRSLGIAVAQARVERDFSIDAVAGAARIDRTTLMRLEAGSHAVSVRVLHNVAHALGVPIGPLAEALCSDRQQDTHSP